MTQPPPGPDEPQPYPVYYQAAPTGGYAVPIFGQQAGYDPLISPNYGGWWQRTIAILKTAWKPLATLQAIGVVANLIVSVPPSLYLVYLQSQLPQNDPNAPVQVTEVDLGPLLAVFGVTFLGIFLALLVQFAVVIASNHVGVAVASGMQPQIGRSLALAAKRVFPLIGWQLLAGLITLVGFCACILPGFYLIAVFLVLPVIVTFERTNVISRCFQLFHGDLGSSIARVATVWGISIGVAVIAGIIGQVIQVAFSGTESLTGNFETTGPVLTAALTIGIIVSSVFSAILTAAGSVLTAPLTLTAYADMRSRVEPGLSTARLASEIELAPAASPEWGAPPA
ncbi:hypothetical protein KZZ52_08565 [Dactylosporangium sp. AC04546]|uniref:hypothetical protein n=1 Tax=Dactylosporangium sp. AC04546 TaxID=2862460 RepID=UPI001EDE017C|nr:hypothetical protein [Dactylosporangium sp. AC04546]WVK85422.1 hypothetical protein KZZ52_08565 [Dactylosporangium sp. AC04546]